MKHNDSSDLLSTGEVAALLPLTSKQTVSRWARQGKLPFIELPSGRRLFRRKDIEQILTPHFVKGNTAAHSAERPDV